jgi:hypothetical protein
MKNVFPAWASAPHVCRSADHYMNGGGASKAILRRSWSVFVGALVVCLLQFVSQEQVALAQQNGPITLPRGSAIPDGYRLTTGGLYRHKSCIVPVPKHARVWPDMVVRDESGNVLKSLQQPCSYPAYRIGPGGNAGAAPAPGAGTGGWIAGAYQWVPSGYGGWTELETEVIVPSIPNDINASIAYWSGIEPQTHLNLVLQPEIFWGNFAYNNESGDTGWMVMAGAQFTDNGYDGWYICSGSESNGGTGYGSIYTGNDEPCAWDYANPNDVVEFLIELIAITSQCGNEMTNTGIQYVCGDWAWYELIAYDETQGVGESLTVGEVLNSGADEPTNGSVFPLALPAVYESYNDTGCEPGALFDVETLEASNSSSFFNSVSYSPTLCPDGTCLTGYFGNSICGDSAGVSGGLTFVH